jgi:hypothetical protein
LIKLLVTPNEPLERGTRYATTAGVHVGSHEHTHFEFKIGRPRQNKADRSAGDSIAVPVDFDDQSERAKVNPEVLHLDPWIVFWRIFEDRSRREGKIRAAMKPLEPGRTGRRIEFSAEDSRPTAGREDLNYYWTFGDGGYERGPRVYHVFSKAGVYPVTVVADDGGNRASFTQHITISGDPVKKPVLALGAADEMTFRTRPASVADTYDEPPRFIPHTISFTARQSHPRPRVKVVSLNNTGGGILPAAKEPQVLYERGQSWLKTSLKGNGNHQSVQVEVDATGLWHETYSAIVTIECPTAVNSPQAFGVRLRVPETAPESDVTIDDRDPGFYATPYFWVGHRFCRCPFERRGCDGFYLTNGRRARDGEFVRFTPDLEAGRYTVSFPKETPFSDGTEFNVRVRHLNGEETLRIRPALSHTIGTFDFGEGTDGFVEIPAAGSKGLVVADALRFRRGS